ncbi:uncharacterized protein LOC126893862 [Daktulosphaira vitifoliae]|uniref:uncharacterized protein LOC126893862 n=1 Tax=Daktulosphaira vitifoliae TaxID=58002 RepID=UPI0021A9ADD3|nr:uncharacterized protein LOC126893862 [Daktulosphaira vitifoliae]
MISYNIYLTGILKKMFVILILTNKILAVNEKIYMKPPDYNSTFSPSFLHVISTFENDIASWILVNYKNEINYSPISPDDVKLLSKACENDYDCIQKKINSLKNLKVILESLECFHVLLSLQIINILESDMAKRKENLNHKSLSEFKYLKIYPVRMISFFTYGKSVVNPWQFDFSTKVHDMIRFENSKDNTFELQNFEYVNNSSLLTSMNEFCENCEKSNQFFASFTSVLTKTYQGKSCPFINPDNVRCYIKKMLSKINISCIIKMDRISYMSIKIANQQKIKIDPDLEKKKHDFLKSLKLSKQEIENYERNTINATSWHLKEKEIIKRLHASKFYRLCKILPTTCNKSIMKEILHTNRKEKFSVTDENDKTRNELYRNSYGRNNENVAIKEFENKMNIKIEPCGVFIDENLNYLTANPDGLIGNDGIVEVKCPFKIRNMFPEVAIKKNKMKYVHFDKNGNLVLQRNSKYFYQIQGELHITKRDYCYLIIWTQKGMTYIIITRDDQFWKDYMERELIDFYENRMLPELISR